MHLSLPESAIAKTARLLSQSSGPLLTAFYRMNQRKTDLNRPDVTGLTVMPIG